MINVKSFNSLIELAEAFSTEGQTGGYMEGVPAYWYK